MLKRDFGFLRAVTHRNPVSSVFQIERLMPVDAHTLPVTVGHWVVCFQWHLRVFLYTPLKPAGSEAFQPSRWPVCVSRIHCFGSALEGEMLPHGH